jgi:hypothetical protein
MSALVDEACDLLAQLPTGGIASNPVLAQAGSDLKTTILTSLLNQVMTPPSHGSTKESVGSVQETDTPNEQEEGI